MPLSIEDIDIKKIVEKLELQPGDTKLAKLSKKDGWPRTLLKSEQPQFWYMLSSKDVDQDAIRGHGAKAKIKECRKLYIDDKQGKGSFADNPMVVKTFKVVGKKEAKELRRSIDTDMTFFKIMHGECELLELRDNGNIYVVMPAIPGLPLFKLNYAEMNTMEFTNFIIALFDAMHDMYAKGIFHGDLSNANIHYDASTKKAWILDFETSGYTTHPFMDRISFINHILWPSIELYANTHVTSLTCTVFEDARSKEAKQLAEDIVSDTEAYLTAKILDKAKAVTILDKYLTQFLQPKFQAYKQPDLLKCLIASLELQDKDMFMKLEPLCTKKALDRHSNNESFLPIHLACVAGDITYLRALLTKGVDVNAPLSKNKLKDSYLMKFIDEEMQVQLENISSITPLTLVLLMRWDGCDEHINLLLEHHATTELDGVFSNNELRNM